MASMSKLAVLGAALVGLAIVAAGAGFVQVEDGVATPARPFWELQSAGPAGLRDSATLTEARSEARQARAPRTAFARR